MKRAAVLAFALLTAGLIAFTGIVSTQAAAVCDPGAFLFRESRLWHFDPLTTSVTSVTSLPRSLNAMGVKGTDFYAIARPPARAVRFGTDGVLTDLGPIAGAPADHFAAAYSGAIDGDNWYLLQDDTIYTVSLPKRAVIGTAPVSGVDIGDWAFYEGNLLALSTIGATDLVSIDPATGAVTRLSEPAGLPSGSSFGALWIIDEQLYTLHNGTGQLYRLDMSNPSIALPTGTGGLTTDSSDAASCPASLPPPSPSPLSPPPTCRSTPPPLAAPSPESPAAAPPAVPNPAAQPLAAPNVATQPLAVAPPAALSRAAATIPANERAAPLPPAVTEARAAGGAPKLAGVSSGCASLGPSASPSAIPSPSPAAPVGVPGLPEPAVPVAALPIPAGARPAVVEQAAPTPAVPSQAVPVVTKAPQIVATAHAVPQGERNAPVAAPLPDRSRTRRWVAAGVVALGIGGMLGFLGVNRSRS